MLRRLLIAVISLALAGAWVPAVPHAQEGRFRAAADAVLVDVCVTAREGRLVRDLAAGDFVVLENNHPQDLQFFVGEQRLPLAVTLLIDRSASMTGWKVDAAAAAARSFLDTLHPDDLVEVMAFNERASLLFPLGPDHDLARNTLSRLSGNGSTSLWQALLAGLQNLERHQRRDPAGYRHALVILSDGDDTRSLVSFEDVLDEARRSGVIVYGISFRTDRGDRWLAPPRELLQLAFDTGGRAAAAATPAALTRLYQEVGAELRSFYRIGYVPTNSTPDGQWRSISVRVPGQDVQVRARSGYYAMRHLRR